MSVWRSAMAALLAAGLLLLAACATGSGQAGPDPSTTRASVSANRGDTTVPPAPNLARFYRQQLAWHGCGDGFQCTRLLVPIDYAHPRAGTMKIAVNRLRASGARRGSLLVNPGGPGAS
ncbi:MAG TPA: alpha/beta hydrolase, partial [Mycobacteriales bacterium]|nr:alpha/beta hydrolase [Mycobacteriales bacterium]